ncbi:MAG: hypothetical protein ACJ74M_06500 [Gaiellaceae bacterium]|jgi:hypothetical protein
MENEAWPTPQTPARDPLPRVEDLPLAEQGYEQESVKAAFDSFYRHAAQLDAALRTLEAVDSFHRHASALRSDLRALRSAGWTQQSWPGSPPSYGYGLRAPREGVSPVVWRIAGEVAFLIAVAVAVGLANLSWWTILLAMAGALLIVCAIEWAAGREELTYAQPAPAAPVHPVVEAQRSEDTEEHDALGWTAFEEAQEPSDAMTIIGALPRDDAEAPSVDAPAESEGGDEEPEPELPPAAEEEHEPVVAQGSRRRWWQRSGAEEVQPEQVDDAPRHVRVLPPAAADPWEQSFDGDEAGEDDEDDGRRFFRKR